MTPLSFLVTIHRKCLPSWKWGAQRAQRYYFLVETGFKPVSTKNLNKNRVLPSV